MERTRQVRPAVAADAGELAACQVACWREAYAHLLSPSFLAGLTADERRQHHWRQLVAEGSGRRVLVALANGHVVGYSTTGASRDVPAARDLELVSLYLRAAHHGHGLGQDLLEAAVADRPCSLWMAEDNPRASAFYARNGFHPDGARKIETAWEDLAEVRLVR